MSMQKDSSGSQELEGIRSATRAEGLAWLTRRLTWEDRLHRLEGCAAVPAPVRVAHLPARRVSEPRPALLRVS
jgi:hypothetical protein